MCYQCYCFLEDLFKVYRTFNEYLSYLKQKSWIQQQTESREVPLRSWFYVKGQLQQMDVGQVTWLLISLTKFITCNFCLLCIFLYPKLWIKLRCYKVLHSVKMQRKWHIYSRSLQNPTTFCTWFLSSCLSWISFTAQENPLSSDRGWGPHMGWLKGLKIFHWANSCFLRWLTAVLPTASQQVLLLLESSWIFAFLLENCVVAKGEKCCRSILAGPLRFSRHKRQLSVVKTQRTGPASPRQCSHGGTSHDLGAPCSVVQLLWT